MSYQIIIRDFRNNNLCMDEKVEDLDEAIKTFWERSQNYSGNKVNFTFTSVPTVKSYKN